MQKKNCAIIEVLLSLVLILGSIGLACSAEPTSAPPQSSLPSMAPDPEIPGNFTDNTVFSISYPSDWDIGWETALSLMPGLEKEAKEALSDIQAGLPVEKPSVIFIAGKRIAMAEGAGIDPSVSIVVEPIPNEVSTLDQMVETEIKGIEMFVQDRREFSRVKATIDGREAAIVDYEGIAGKAGKRHYLMMITLAGETAWRVTCSSTAEDFATWQKDFNATVRSLRISD